MSAYTCAPIDALHPLLATHLHSRLIQSARFDETAKCYKFERNGITVTCGGVHSMLRYTFYPHYQDNRSRRKGSVQIQGSSKSIGKRVDNEIALAVERRLPKKPHKMTSALLNFWKEAGETLQAAQVPVVLTTAQSRMTQADVITKDSKGRLILYEIKTGAPVGFHIAQDTFQVEHVSDIKCTKKHIWQLQLAYTRMALEKSGVPIHASYVLQIYQHKQQGLVIDPQTPPGWTQKLPLSPQKMPYVRKAFPAPLAPKKTAFKKRPRQKKRVPPPKAFFKKRF